MAIGFSEDLFDKIVAVHWPVNGDIVGLHIDFIYESDVRTDYLISVAAVPTTGVNPDFEKPFPKTADNATRPQSAIGWGYTPKFSKVQTSTGGGVTVVDVGEYLPQITFVKNGQNQSVLIAVNPYHTISLPQMIDWDSLHRLGGVTPTEANTILANVAALYAGDFSVPVINSQWILTTPHITHFNPGGVTTNTHIEFQGMMVFDLARLKKQNPTATMLNITLTLQGQLASGDINCTWNTECTSWRKAGAQLPVDSFFNPAWSGNLVGDLLFQHTFDETTVNSFTVTYQIDLKTLNVTGTSNG